MATMKNITIVLLLSVLVMFGFILDNNIKKKNEIVNFKIQIDKYQQQIETLNAKYSEMRGRQRDQQDEVDNGEKQIKAVQAQLEKCQRNAEKEKGEVMEKFHKEKQSHADDLQEQTNIRKEYKVLQEKYALLEEQKEKNIKEISDLQIKYNKLHSEVVESRVIIALNKKFANMSNSSPILTSSIAAHNLNAKNDIAVNITSGPVLDSKAGNLTKHADNSASASLPEVTTTVSTTTTTSVKSNQKPLGIAPAPIKPHHGDGEE